MNGDPGNDMQDTRATAPEATTPGHAHTDRGYRGEAFEAAAVAMWLQDLSAVKHGLEQLQEAGVTDIRQYLRAHPRAVSRLASKIRIRDVNPCCVRLHEAPSKATLIDRAAETLLPETLYPLREALIAMFERRRDFQMPTRLRTLDGRKLYVVAAIRFPPADDAFERVFVSTVDVTLQTQAETEREIVEARYHQAVEASPIGVVVADTFGRIEHANPALYRILHYEDHELEDRSWRELTHPDDARTSREMIRSVTGDGPESAQSEKRYLRKDGVVVWARVHLSTLPSQSGGPPRLICFIDDITEQVAEHKRRDRLAEKMRRANMLESLGVLAGGVAHDFNNLLVGVMGHAGIARGKLERDSPVQADLRQIEDAAARAAELTSQMLAYSGGGAFVLQNVQLGRGIDELRGLLEVALPAGAKLELRTSSAEPTVRIDVTQLRQLAINLVTNAAESFDGQGGTVRIETGRIEADATYLRRMYVDDDLAPGPYAFLDVADTGCGIEADTLDRIFDPFFTTKRMGRGLGLAAVLGIVRGHGGAIRIDSVTGRGTVVRVLFPIARSETPQGEAPAEPECPVQERRSLSILLAEDKPLVLDVAREMLQTGGHRVTAAKDGEEAVEKFVRGQYDLVILDLTMPRMNGVEAFRRIRDLEPGMPVIFSSGHAERAVLAETGGSPRPLFVQKPYRLAALLDAVAEATGSA